jgi:hypothetical protein
MDEPLPHDSRAKGSVSEAENARLQAQAEESKRWLGTMCVLANRWKTERDGYKARDKLRGEALKLAVMCTHPGISKAARTAIDISPEEAREKEKE